MTVMAKVSTSIICENAKMARDYASRGDYDGARVFYESVLQSLQQHVNTIADPMRKGKWTMVNTINITIWK